ncbi:unnamed protein product [Nezara viridula]|uniref:ADAM10 endopeptidase n=1 Tax=Nezara viridula TaxID=85310 RepID=A0A9P0HJV1_NEZVI|nr:unnamed protein product [Nezara viridula]
MSKSRKCHLDVAGTNRLNEYIRHYEEASYNRFDAHSQHERSKRSTNGKSHIQIGFRAHGRDFRIRLRRDTSGFASEDLEVVGSDNKPVPVSLSHIYQGYVLGEPGSTVFGALHDGIFEGKIISKYDNYYVEKASRYFPRNNSFHSVIYKESDVEDPYMDVRSGGHVGGCGVNTEASEWMERVQNSAVEEEDSPETDKRKLPKKYNAGKETKNKKESEKTVKSDDLSKHKKTLVSNSEDNIFNDSPYSKYSREANTRKKRAARPKEENRNTCSLFIQTDPLIWRHISEQIDDDAPCNPNYRGEPNPFCMENIDVSNFLNLHSLGNHEAFCLAYVFTYRDFNGGTLGLAWVASASGASGGICERYKTYTETVGGLYQSTKRSLNTGIITFVNYNSRVPPKVSQLTLAHEIGHNFGSPHDYPQECRPGGLKGNYIMFASATSGDRPNNSKFSSCSIGNISKVLDAIEIEKKANCFKASAGAFCGNKIVEDGEECDCGYDELECRDKCCYPRLVNDSEKRRNTSAKGCTRRANTQCSPSQGPCCLSDQCRFVPASHNIQCKPESECSWSSVCDGRTAQCPRPMPKANKTRCNEGTQVCLNGECRGSICLEWNMTECFLTSQASPNIDKRQLCELACQNGTDVTTCRSTSEFAARLGLPSGGISLTPGSPCDNFQGYCDVFLKCRAVDAEGPLVRLKNLLFNKENLLTLRQWAETPASGGRAGPRRGPAHGYGEGRGHYYPPKASAPPPSRSDLYAGAYSDRNAFHMRQHKV